ncbi:hypothetical protein J6590_007982 [Homalodisca vitripennis]|nr:hypothetical protein J6590_007982 [Homalodisca vitripennis]
MVSLSEKVEVILWSREIAQSPIQVGYLWYDSAYRSFAHRMLGACSAPSYTVKSNNFILANHIHQRVRGDGRVVFIFYCPIESFDRNILPRIDDFDIPQGNIEQLLGAESEESDRSILMGPPSFAGTRCIKYGKNQILKQIYNNKRHHCITGYPHLPSCAEAGHRPLFARGLCNKRPEPSRFPRPTRPTFPSPYGRKAPCVIAGRSFVFLTTIDLVGHRYIQRTLSNSVVSLLALNVSAPRTRSLGGLVIESSIAIASSRSFITFPPRQERFPRRTTPV